MTGYLHPDYARSFAGFGRPLPLPASEGWLVQRAIPGTEWQDAMGCYPLFSCRDWQKLPDDLEQLDDRVVSLSLVTDPLGEWNVELLERAFPDVCRPYKDHYLTDLTRPVLADLPTNHRRNVRRALGTLAIERCRDPLDRLDDWERLYDRLRSRHSIRGWAAFSRQAFAVQLSVPGIIVFRARREDETVGMVLWYVQEDRAYYHLAAYDDTGYESKASFGLFHHAIEAFANEGLRWLCLGAGAGVAAGTQDGLTRFKQGWATTTRPVYFCGRILQPARYRELVRMTETETESFFPAYRSGEFT